MKNILLFLLLACGIGLNAQVVQTSYTVPTIAAMKLYYGQANRIHVLANSTDYVICNPCTTDEVTIFAGAGGKKWKRVIPASIPADSLVDGTNNRVFSSSDKSKLDGIAAGATANATNAQLRDRSTHTGTQAQSTITNLTSDLLARLLIADTSAARQADRNYALGLANLRLLISDTAARGAQYQLAINKLRNYFDTASVVFPMDTLLTTKYTDRPASSAIIRTKLDSIIAAMAGLGTGGPVAWSAITDKPTTRSGYGITDAQAYDADLDAIAALSPANDDIIQRKSGAWTIRTMAQLKADLGLNNVDNTSNATERAATATLENKTIVAPVLSGNITGTYNIGGSPTFPSSVVLTTSTQSLTNKRITARVGTTASGTTITPHADNHDTYTVTALAANATFAAPAGTPTDMQPLLIRIKDNGTARTLTWNAIYRAGDIALPTTTVISKTMYAQFVYNLADTKWDFVGLTSF